MLAVTVFGLLFVFSAICEAQAPQAPQPAPAAALQGARLRVFLDCDCFQEYLRDELKWVDYVRQAQDADIHLLSNTATTGGGGRELVLRFVGRGRFDGVNQELRVVTLPAETEDTERRLVLRTVSVGLLTYLARTGLPDALDLSVRLREAVAAGKPARDPWNLWFFEAEASGSLQAEEAQSELRSDISISADRVTADWKIAFGAEYERQFERFTIFDEDDPAESGILRTRRRETNIDGLVVRSLGPHWSFGVSGNVSSSTFGNTQFSFSAGPAIEYSIFPYAEYATRQLVAQYEVAVERAEYNEITIFDKIEETLLRHEIELRLDQRQPWGTLQAGVEFSQYFHDFSKYRFEVSGEVEIRITRGLSISVDGSASRIHDQLSLPKRNATPAEILLQLRELQSAYEIDFSFGITYSFGSLFNNIVNPRFGG
jgi:hypothetical protein